MKKFLSVLLLVAALFVTSCSAEVPELLAFIDDSGSDGVDYGGVKIIVSSSSNSMNDKETYWTGILSYDTNTMYGEAIMDRIATVEENLGVTIGLHKAEDADAMRLVLMSGTYVADLVHYTDFGGMQNFAQAGMLLPLTNFDVIDLTQTEKYGGANVLEGAMINSVPYAVQPVSWPRWESIGITSIIYNMDIMDEFGITDPHEFWETENWYWDTFEETYLKGVDLPAEDEWVMSASEKLFYYALAYSNDLQYVYATPDGEYAVNAKPQALIETLQEGVEWVRDYSDKLKLFSDFWTHEDYDNELALFTISDPDLAGTSQVRSGLMPFPCGPSCEYGYWPQAFDRIEGFGIPISSHEPEIAAHVISELFEPLDEYLGPLDEYYRDMIFNTETDAEIYMELCKDARYDYTFAGGSDLMRGVNNSFSSAIKSGKAANEAADTYAAQVLAIMTAHALPNFDYMYKNYYSLQDAD